ncbi:unnamed protein product [Adineta steineri]|uniref:Uncharacterized protein n=1 Tax=Adineta steineri TaxID=433720 RepID=A0A819PJL4_9BILA|nr:unnamed protein product [Adineta steineri]CAF4014043.1 unnamed protein product [Adineta steineri]
MVPLGFLYDTGRLGSGTSDLRAVPTTGTITGGGYLYYLSISNLLNEQLLASNTLAITIGRLGSDVDPHFVGRKPIVESPGFYDYNNPTAPISQIIQKTLMGFQQLDYDLSKSLNDNGFQRVF